VLGISVKDASGKLRDSNAVMLEIANRFHDMPDGAAKTAIALGLFGKAGAEMIPMLDQGGDAISKLSTKMTAAFAEKADDYKKRLAALGGQVQALGIDLAEALLPALEKITIAVTQGIEAFNKLPGPVKDLAVGGALIALAWGPITGIFSGAVGLFAAAANGMELLAYQTALAGGVMPLLAGGIEGVGLAIASVPIVGWIAAGITALSLLGVALYNNDSDFHNWADNIAGVVKGDFQGAMDTISSSSKSAFDSVAEDVGGFNKIVSDVCGKVAQGFTNLFSSIATQAKSAFTSISQTIAGWWNQLPAPVRSAMQTAGNFAGAAAQMVLVGPFGSYANSANQRAFQKGGQYGPNLTPDMISSIRSRELMPKPFNPSLPGGGGANLGKLDTAAIDEANQLNAEIKKLQILSQQDAIQKQINADSLLESQYARDKNISGEERMQIAIAQLEFQKQAIGIEADYQLKLQENNKIKDDDNHKLADQVALTDRNLKLDEARTAAVQKRAVAEQRAGFALEDQARAQKNALDDIANRYKYSVIGSEQGKDAEQQQRELDGVRRQLEDHVITLKEYEERVNAINKSYADMAKLGNSALHGVKEGLQSYLDSIGTLADSIGNAVKGTLGKLEDALINFANTGKLNFRDLANYAIQQLERIVIEQAIMKPLTGALKGFLGGFGFANGGIMSAAGPVPLRTYATGGIATSPQMALFGEGSTPEAYVPLPDGRRIPVAMKGGGSTPVINVAVDAKGTSVTGNSGQASQLARVIAVAVQNELIKQKRPGGLIAA